MAHEILVVDDDKLTRWSLARMLARFGYCVREAGLAAEGLAQAGESPPDLVLLDLRLLDKDGGSVLRSLRESRPELPVIMMSADATPPSPRGRRLSGQGLRGWAIPVPGRLSPPAVRPFRGEDVRPIDVRSNHPMIPPDSTPKCKCVLGGKRLNRERK